MKKRGISPLIASVLLIAFTIMLFVLISTWVRKSTIEPTMQAGEEKLGSALECMNTKVEIASMCYKDNKIKFDVDNVGDTDLVGIGLRVVGSKVSEMLPIEGAAAPYGRFPIHEKDFTGADYGDVTKWKIEVYPKTKGGICRDAMDISSVIVCTS